jgi:acyl carrier protein
MWLARISPTVSDLAARLKAVQGRRPSMKKHDDLILLFKQVATEVDKREFSEMTGDSVISELGIDSLSMMQIVGEMELRLDILIPDEDLVELITVADLVKVVERRLGS